MDQVASSWRTSEHFTIIAQLRSLLTIGRFLRISFLASSLLSTSCLSVIFTFSLFLFLFLALSFIQSHTLAVSTNGRSLLDDARPQLGKSMAIAFAGEYVSNGFKLIEPTDPPSCQYHDSLLLIREPVHRFYDSSFLSRRHALSRDVL